MIVDVTMTGAPRLCLSVVLAFLAVVLTWAQPALSQSGDEISALEHALRAEAYARGGDWEASLAELEASYALEPTLMSLFNTAVCHEMLGHYQRAAELFLQVLDQAPWRSRPELLAREHLEVLFEKGLAQRSPAGG